MNYIQSLRKYIGTEPIIAPGSAVIVLNDKGEILLQLRSDTLDWGIPGGGMELGDSFEETARKELFEETGLTAPIFGAAVARLRERVLLSISPWR